MAEEEGHEEHDLIEMQESSPVSIFPIRGKMQMNVWVPSEKKWTAFDMSKVALLQSQDEVVTVVEASNVSYVLAKSGYQSIQKKIPRPI